MMRTVAALGMMLCLSGCASGLQWVLGFCATEPQGQFRAVAQVLFGCPTNAAVAQQRPEMPATFQNQEIRPATGPGALDLMNSGAGQDVALRKASSVTPAKASAIGSLTAGLAKPVQIAARLDPEDMAQAPILDLRPPSEWWRLFGSEELNRLAEMALANNHDLKAAVARVQQARAAAGIAAGALLPTLDYSGSGQSSRPNGGIGNTIPIPDGNSQRLYRIGGAASYELDFWGKNAAAMESALATAQSSRYERETVVMSLLAEVTTTYFQYLAFSDRLSVAVGNVANVTDVLATVQKRFSIGEGSDIEVQQQGTALAQARSVVTTISLARELARLRLTSLIGTAPAALNLTGSSLAVLTLPSPPRLVPSSLFAYRPDLRKAEADLIAANADISIARGKLLPSFTISAETGFGSHYINSLFTPAGWYNILATSVSGVLFDNGKTLSDIDLRKAIYNERAETYRQRALDALRDVEEALASIRLNAEVEASQRVALQHATRAYELAQMGLRLGTIDYLTILDTERTKYQIEDSTVLTRLDRLNAAISMFRSIGGATGTMAPST